MSQILGIKGANDELIVRPALITREDIAAALAKFELRHFPIPIRLRLHDEDVDGKVVVIAEFDVLNTDTGEPKTINGTIGIDLHEFTRDQIPSGFAYSIISTLRVLVMDACFFEGKRGDEAAHRRLYGLGAEIKVVE